MGEGTERPEDLGPLVREQTLELKLKVLQQALTIRIIAAVVATSTLPHLGSLPSQVTVGAVIAGVYKIVSLRIPF